MTGGTGGNRTPVRKPSPDGSTCVAGWFVFEGLGRAAARYPCPESLGFRPGLNDAAKDDPTCMTLLYVALRPYTQPIGKLVQGSPVLSGEGETFVVRSYLFPVVLRANWCSACPAPTPYPRRSQVGPESLSLGQFEPVQERLRRFSDVVGAPSRHRLAVTQITPGSCNR